MGHTNFEYTARSNAAEGDGVLAGHVPGPSSAPVLLTVGQFYGTLAAVRSLGRAGVPVTLAEGHALAPARWSRYVTRRIRCPEPIETDAFLSFLMRFGDGAPGHVLLPSSDEVAWLIAENQEELARRFHVVPVPFAAVDGLLDKRALHEHCQAVGIDVPETRFPASEEEAIAAGTEVGFPLILKPRTQVLLDSRSKGALVEEPAELVPRLRRFLSENHHRERIRRRSPDVSWPMLQRYYPAGREDIYGLSGYVDGAGEIVAARASRKIFQRPRKLGIGLCFEEAPIDEGHLARVAALCRRVSYRGVFEVELVRAGERSVLIDFNPRFFGQMAFDVDRGMALPRLARADALGDRAAFAALAAEASAPRAGPPRVFCHRLLFEMALRAQAFSGSMRAEEVARWRRWWAEHRDHATDAVADMADPAPWAADVAMHIGAMARHPRSSLRLLMSDR